MNPVFPMVSQLVLNNMHKLMSTTLFVCQLDASKLDYNWRFLVEFFATFAPVGVPSLAKFKAWFIGHKNSMECQACQTCFFFPALCHDWKAVFYICAQRYGFFPPKTVKKSIKVSWSMHSVMPNAICFACVDYINKIDNSIGDLLQAWAGLTAGIARSLAVHALGLASRSEGSRLV